MTAECARNRLKQILEQDGISSDDKEEILQIADILSSRTQWETDAMSIIKRAAAVIDKSKIDYDEKSLLWYLSEIRQVSGDNGKRMLPQLVDYIQVLKARADRYEKLRKLNPRQIHELWTENIKTGMSFDELIDRL